MGRLGVTGILAFMERNDSIQPVVGVERPRLGELGLVGLYPQPQIHHGMHVGMSSDEFQHFRDGVAGFRSGQIHWVRSTPPWWQFGVDLGPQIVGQRHEDQMAIAGDGVRGDHPPTPGSGHHHHIGPSR